jgi:cobaltochelatase CobT
MRLLPVRDGPAGEPYRIYTEAFDLTLDALDVRERLSSASPDGAKGWLHMNDRAWDAAVSASEAWLDERRQALAAFGEEMLQRWTAARAALATDQFVISLLIDQSGSMKGDSIAAVAATASWLCELATRLGARIEILGFSTAGWQGGHAYRKWLASGRPRRPGRLCALMHVIYKDAEEIGLRPEARRTMLHPDLLRENVDGEALRWAARRLSSRAEPHKLLVVISDGAPVDDVTLLHNGLSYLRRDLVASIRALDEAGTILVGAVGLNHRVSEFYPVSTLASSGEALPRATAELVEEMIGRAAGEAARPS